MSLQDDSHGEEMSTSLEMLTMALVSLLLGSYLYYSLLISSVTKAWFKDREKGSRDETGESFALSVFQTLCCCSERANLSDIQTFLIFSSMLLFSFRAKFFIDSGFNYCRVVCEANMKLLLMIY